MSRPPVEPFAVTTHPSGDGGVAIAVTGEMDLANVDDLEAALEAQRTCHRHVVLDLGELQFLDSTGIDLLARAHADARRDGWALSLSPVLTAPVRRTLVIAGLIDDLHFTGPPVDG